MISIVTAYYNRKELFYRTLQSIKLQKSSNLLEVIAVDDGSDEHERLEDLVDEFPFLKIVRIEPQQKWHHNSCVPFNMGFKMAKGDIIIFQNPECLHFGNVIDAANTLTTANNLTSFACFSLNKADTTNLDRYIEQPGKIQEIIDRNNHFVEHFAGAPGWYNHSVHYPGGRHYCNALTRKNILKLHGFDERFALGIAADDDEMLERINKFFKITIIDQPFVLHQNHYGEESKSYENRESKRELHVRNLYMLKNRSEIFNPNVLFWHIPFKFRKFFIQAEYKFEVLLTNLKKPK